MDKTPPGELLWFISVFQRSEWIWNKNMFLIIAKNKYFFQNRKINIFFLFNDHGYPELKALGWDSGGSDVRDLERRQ